jgi:hypothetical protein
VGVTKEREREIYDFFTFMNNAKYSQVASATGLGSSGINIVIPP